MAKEKAKTRFKQDLEAVDNAIKKVVGGETPEEIVWKVGTAEEPEPIAEQAHRAKTEEESARGSTKGKR